MKKKCKLCFTIWVDGVVALFLFDAVLVFVDADGQHTALAHAVHDVDVPGQLALQEEKEKRVRKTWAKYNDQQ